MSRKTDKRRPLPPATSHSNPPGRISQVSISRRSGPLPDPSELEGYEKVLPGAAERIMAMVENQSAHRQQLENRAIALEARNSLFGIIAGLVIGVTGLLISGYCISRGYQWGGGALGGTTLASLVYTFVYESSLFAFQKGWSLPLGTNGLFNRALGVDIAEGVLWFWIGSPADYDKLVS